MTLLELMNAAKEGKDVVISAEQLIILVDKASLSDLNTILLELKNIEVK